MRQHVIDDVAVSASSAGLRMECLRCHAVELVLVTEAAFNDHIERFMGCHPVGCPCR